MSQDPLRSIRRRAPRRRGVFPDENLRRDWLEPSSQTARLMLLQPTLRTLLAHVLMLGEQRIAPSDAVAGAARALTSIEVESSEHAPPLALVLSGVRNDVADTIMLGLSRDDVEATAGRLMLRAEALDLMEAVLRLRERVAELAAGHLTTTMLLTANGQVVQPTTLGHYLASLLGPLARCQERLHEAFARVNRSPMGAVSGVATAMPIRRGRVAELLGFEGVIDNTVDALSANDSLYEMLSIVAGLAVELTRFVADLSHWSRDDMGLLLPGDEFVHGELDQPQRRDPIVIDHLRVGLSSMISAPSQLAILSSGQIGTTGSAARIETLAFARERVRVAVTAINLLASVVRTAEVNRAMFANRANRGFATSSELADLLIIDHGLTRSEAMEITRRVVIEVMELGGDATTVTPEVVDRVALRVIGREIGIEPEALARCLSPRRFVERRAVTGGPAPNAVGLALEREQIAHTRDRGWMAERRNRMSRADDELTQFAEQVMSNPRSVTARRQRAPVEVRDSSDGRM